jgi:hypothetical protein
MKIQDDEKDNALSQISIVTRCLRTGIAEQEETLIARQQLSKHVPMTTYTQATIQELSETSFSVQCAKAIQKGPTGPSTELWEELYNSRVVRR